MLRFARNDVKGRFRGKLGMMYEKELPRQAEHDKLVKNWRNKRNSVQGECRDRPLAGRHDRTDGVSGNVEGFSFARLFVLLWAFPCLRQGRAILASLTEPKVSAHTGHL